MTLPMSATIVCAFFIAVGVDRAIQSIVARRQARKYRNEHL